MFARVFIDRPILAMVIAIVITLAGAVAMGVLPVAQYPDISPPQITVSASYPGADAETVAQAVAAPLELQINGVDDMIYMSSSSTSTGNVSISVLFEIGTDPADAQVDVQNRVNLALAQLPDAVKTTGVQVQKRSSSFLIILAIYSPDDRYDANYINNYANLYVLDALKRVPGANQASVIGNADAAMRIWLRPDRMAQLGITTADVRAAVAGQNQQFAAGRIGNPPNAEPVQLSFPVTTQGRLSQVSQFENIILRAASAETAIVYLKDVARVELAAKDYVAVPKLNGHRATVIAVYQQADANALEVSRGVRAELERLKKSFPAGLDYRIGMDTTEFVQEAIDEVLQTLIEAVILVVLVVYLFLHRFVTTLIPCLAIVVSIVGTFTGLWAMGFSINLLTLFAMVLAIGIVVDDAIVVVENVERNIEQHGLAPRDATLRAMGEVTGPVVATTLVLMAVFIPVAFLGGITGQLYMQFALTIAISVGISAIVALTLTPALCALLLKPHAGAPNRFFAAFNRRFAAVTDRYGRAVGGTLRRTWLMLAIYAVMIALTLLLFRTVPGSFVPAEDQGSFLTAVMLPDAASLERTEAVADRVSDIILKQGAADRVVSVAGFSILDSGLKNNAAAVFVGMKPFAERAGEEALQIGPTLAALGQRFRGIREAFALPINPPAIPGLGSVGGFEFWIQSRGEGTNAQLDDIARKFIQAASQRPELQGVNTTFKASNMQLRLDVDREKAQTLGVPIEDVYDSMQTLFGSVYASQFNLYSRVWWVILQAEPAYRNKPGDLRQIYVRSANGTMIPLSTLVTTRYLPGPDIVPRFNGFPAAKLTGNAAPGYSSGQALAAMEAVAAQVLPAEYSFAWSGQAYEEKRSGGSSVLAFGFGILMAFLILAALYEQWSLPFAVILAVPFGLFGAILAVWLRGTENDVYFQIGLVTLIGLAAKNAILIVEFAAERLQGGMSLGAAAVEAARLRLRPIIMTSLCFILGVVPLVIASGAGANSRHSIGTGVMGGMLAATFLAIFLVPLFFTLVQRRRAKRLATLPPARHDAPR